MSKYNRHLVRSPLIHPRFNSEATIERIAGVQNVGEISTNYAGAAGNLRSDEERLSSCRGSDDEGDDVRRAVRVEKPRTRTQDEATYVVAVRYWRGDYSSCETPEEFAQAVKDYFMRAGASIEVSVRKHD